METQAITLTFAYLLNVSLQVGDTLYYLAANDEIVQIGEVTNITIRYADPASGVTAQTVVVAQIPVNVTPPTNSSYIFFTKDAQGNTSNLKGYYAEAQFRNNDTNECELFSVGSEIFESSK
jgi:hypothetical protein|tara:strand:- start:523 stop:885 length:363 start_codon:yes stop_codon:yes gene_type:complete